MDLLEEVKNLKDILGEKGDCFNIDCRNCPVGSCGMKTREEIYKKALKIKSEIKKILNI